MYSVLVLLLVLCLSRLAPAATLTVQPGQSIQDALGRAQAGDTVQLDAATYHEQLTIPHDGLTIQGRGHSTILDASRTTSGWTPAPQMGQGVWQARLGSPQAMTAQGKTVWRISDQSMGDGTGKKRLSQGTNDTVKVATGQVGAWDGIEALFGNQGGVTYLRFRDGATPASRDVQVSTGPTIDIGNHSRTTIKDLKVQGGQYAVRITGGSGNVVEGSYLTHGKNRILLDGTASGTIIRKNTLRVDALGFNRFTPGDRDMSPAARQVSRWMYDTSKFLIGDTETNDASILIGGDVRETQILDNDLGYGLMGIVFYGSTRGTVVEHNRVHHMADIGIYVNADRIDATIRRNHFEDLEHGLRLESMHRSTSLDLIENCFVGVTNGAKHIFVAPPKGGNSSANVTVTKNTFRGGGWAVDMGGTGEFQYSIPGLRVWDNVMAVNGISSGGTQPIGALGANRMLPARSSGATCQPSTSPPTPTLPPSPSLRAPRNLRTLSSQ